MFQVTFKVWFIEFIFLHKFNFKVNLFYNSSPKLSKKFLKTSGCKRVMICILLLMWWFAIIAPLKVTKYLDLIQFGFLSSIKNWNSCCTIILSNSLSCADEFSWQLQLKPILEILLIFEQAYNFIPSHILRSSFIGWPLAYLKLKHESHFVKRKSVGT